MNRGKRIYVETGLFLGVLITAFLLIIPWLRDSRVHEKIERRRSDLQYVVNALVAHETEVGPEHFDARRIGTYVVDEGIEDQQVSSRDVEVFVSSQYFTPIDLSDAYCRRRRSDRAQQDSLLGYIEWTIYAPALPGNGTIRNASGYFVLYDSSNGLRSQGAIAVMEAWHLEDGEGDRDSGVNDGY